MKQEFNGVLEVDNDRGVIYFHTTEAEVPTILRICSLGKIPDLKTTQMDITHMYGVGYTDSNATKS